MGPPSSGPTTATLGSWSRAMLGIAAGPASASWFTLRSHPTSVSGSQPWTPWAPRGACATRPARAWTTVRACAVAAGTTSCGRHAASAATASSTGAASWPARSAASPSGSASASSRAGMGAHPRVPGTSTPARRGEGDGYRHWEWGDGAVLPTSLCSEGRGDARHPLKSALCRHLGRAGLPAACCPPGPTREHQGSRPRGDHGHAVQTADTSTARGAEGGHGVGEHLLAPSRTGQGGVGDSRA